MALEVVGEDAFALRQPAPSAGVLGWLDRLQDGVLIALIVAMAAVVNLQIISRYLFDHPFMWAEEVTRLTLVWVTFLGGGLLLRRGSEIMVDSFVALLPARARLWADLSRDVVLVALYSAVIVVAWGVARSVGSMPLIATDWPTSLLVWPVCIGAGFSVLYSVLRIAAGLRPRTIA